MMYVDEDCQTVRVDTKQTLTCLLTELVKLRLGASGGYPVCLLVCLQHEFFDEVSAIGGGSPNGVGGSHKRGGPKSGDGVPKTK